MISIANGNAVESNNVLAKILNSPSYKSSSISITIGVAIPRLTTAIITFFIIITALIYFLPLNYSNIDGVYSYGPAANIIYVFATLCMSIWSILLVINRKKLKDNATIPTYGSVNAAGADLYRFGTAHGNLADDASP